MKTNLMEQAKQIPVVADCDVLVCGGGVAGCAAALAAARNGMRVILLEKGYCLGGLATSGIVCVFLPLCDGCGHQMISGIPEEFFRISVEMGPGKVPDCWQREASVEERAGQSYTAEFNPYWFMMALDKLLTDAGVRLMFDTRLCDAKAENGHLTHVIVENKEGRSAIACKAAVDATGDADLCFLCGEDTVTLDSNRRTSWFYTIEENKMKIHIHGDKFFEPVPEGSRTFNGVVEEDVSEFMLDSRRMAKDLFLREKEKAEHIILGSLPSIPLMRKTRRLKGLREIDEMDEGKYCESAIGRTGYYRKKGLHLYFPYECLIGKTDNLFAAGRCISSKEEFAWNITRGIPSSTVTGQAAGTAAAVCIQNNTTAQKLDVTVLQNTLISQGALIQEFPSSI